MSDLRLSQIAAKTGLSIRYWQRAAAAGKLPGAAYVVLGDARRYVVDAETFEHWWKSQRREIPCQKISGKGAKSGGIASPKTAPRTKDRWKQEASDSLKSDLKQFEKA